MTRADARQALRTAARAGEFFAIAVDPDPGWFPLRVLLVDVAALDDRVMRTRRVVAQSSRVALDDVPLRTAASIDHLGLAARLLSPALGACTLAGVVPRFTPDSLRCRSVDQRVGIVHPVGRPTTAEGAAEALSTDVLAPVVAPLVAAYAGRFDLSTQVLWGNVASALNGAVVILEASGIAQELPAGPVAAALLATPSLTGTALSTTPRFVRNSCCLWYRIPGSATCGDCVLSA